MVLRLVQGFRRQSIVLTDGSGFYYKIYSKRLLYYLRCHNTSCPGRGQAPVDFSSADRVRVTSFHNHPPEHAFEDEIRFRAKLLERCRQESASLTAIYADEVKKWPPEATRNTSLKTFRSSILRERRSANDSIKQALMEMADIFVKPEDISEEQKECLVSHVENDPVLNVDGNRQLIVQKWMNVAQQLNIMPGAEFSHTEWRLLWSELKSSVQKKFSLSEKSLSKVDRQILKFCNSPAILTEQEDPTHDVIVTVDPLSAYSCSVGTAGEVIGLATGSEGDSTSAARKRKIPPKSPAQGGDVWKRTAKKSDVEEMTCKILDTQKKLTEDLRVLTGETRRVADILEKWFDLYASQLASQNNGLCQ
ncbi:MULE transposase domain [Nesidiocoris tenuis]|uniref:MULE transposase domain n=1 Tax=Nesidiocoris tenuis TaxID=355587 RepID=A0ABN7BB39_9HEMI|nr:MULE transposase domain [Nesidiocoris tenuis]